MHAEPAPGAEVFVDLEGEDLPDHFDGPEADLSEWLIETLALALDPYPRKPGRRNRSGLSRRHRRDGRHSLALRCAQVAEIDEGLNDAR